MMPARRHPEHEKPAARRPTGVPRFFNVLEQRIADPDNAAVHAHSPKRTKALKNVSNSGFSDANILLGEL
jgi:hypothetical protein